MILFFSIFFAVYGTINYYIFIRGWQALAALPHLRIYYLIIFLIASLSYLTAKFLDKFLTPLLYDALLWVGSFWFSFMIYFLISIFLIDISRFINGQLNILPGIINQHYEITKLILFFVVIFIVGIINIAGYINTRNPVIRTLPLQIQKKESTIDKLNVALISDVHISPVNDGKLLSKIVNKINELKPDIVLIAGDLVDDKARILKERNIGRSLRKIKSKFGVYGITGNHEFINGIENTVQYARELGVHVLRDSSVKIENLFYLIGRDDRSKKQFTGKDRKSLNELMNDVDKGLPIILMDHTPLSLEKAQNNGIDLQLSGHTHHGQF
ncbi:MAG TPA: metallophosphoesterase, partial [Ignavibacteria bacterium]|nr:metallophosphoesterase [Ignavibacteria bacterium]